MNSGEKYKHNFKQYRCANLKGGNPFPKMWKGGNMPTSMPIFATKEESPGTLGFSQVGHVPASMYFVGAGTLFLSSK